MSPSKPSPSVVVALVTLCLSLALVAVTPPAGAQTASVSVTNVTHTPRTPTAGETFQVRVTLRNYEGADGSFRVNEVYAGSLREQEHIAENVGTLGPGASTVVTLPVTIDEPGWHTFSVNVNGEDPAAGVTRIQHPVTVHVVDEERPQVELAVEDAVPGATRSVNVTVANGAAADLRRVAVTVESPDATFSIARRVTARLPAGNTTTFRFPARVVEGGTYPVNVTVDYAANDEHRRVSRTFAADFSGPPNPGAIRLTGVEAVARGGRLEVSATASNVGSDPVEGVVVSFGDAPNVGSGDYFVGRVDASDFSSFTLTTSLAGNVSSVPVEARYVVDGVEKTVTTEVPVERAAVERPEPSGGGLPVVPAVGAVVLVAGAALLYRRRG